MSNDEIKLNSKQHDHDVEISPKKISHYGYEAKSPTGALPILESAQREELTGGDGNFYPKQ